MLCKSIDILKGCTHLTRLQLREPRSLRTEAKICRYSPHSTLEFRTAPLTVMQLPWSVGLGVEYAGLLQTSCRLPADVRS